jgi:hypothetical protein
MEKINLEKSLNATTSILKDKESDILIKRFGLFGSTASTLASIGKGFKLTRERIRQIQNSSIRKIKNSSEQDAPIFKLTAKLVKAHGGILSVKQVMKEFSTDINHATFILEVSQGLKRIKGDKNLNDAFIYETTSTKDILQAEQELIKILKSKKIAMGLARIIKKGRKNSILSKLEDKTIEYLIDASQSFALDWQKRIGLSVWREINPKSARDKAYFILKKEDRPLHFTHIALLIEGESFCGKSPTAATVHNELILDKRFVLVGRGIYALAEWGFSGGTVEDVIEGILSGHPKGMERDAIIDEVLKSKLVARNTVMMNLLIKKKFVKDSKGNYKLVS